MNQQLKIRVVSSLYSLGVLVLVGVAGFIISPDFTNWVGNSFKEYPFIISFIAYAMPEIAKAIRNYAVTKNATYGATAKSDPTFLI